MPFKFNPFTGNFDQTGSGGGGASYLDGEVATYADLPLDGTAALNSAWLVREASGTWLLGRKPAGIYIRTATGGSSRDADYTYAGILPDVFSDTNFTLYDDADSTKTAKFQLSGISTGTTRTLTVPDSSGTIDICDTRTVVSYSTDQVLPAARNARLIVSNTNALGINLDLPSTSTNDGDLYTIVGGATVSGSIIVRRQVVSSPVVFAELARITAVGQVLTFRAKGSGTDNWELASARALLANNGALTASAPVLDLSQTWNNAAATFTGLRFNVTNTASAAASSLIDLQVGGASLLSVDRSGFIVMTSTAGIRQSTTTNPVLLGGIASFNSAGLSVYGASVRTNRDSHFGWTPDTNHLTPADLQLHRDAADTLAQRRTTNPQAFRLYNTTDAGLTNYERGFMRWSSNVLQIGTEKAGTGSARALEFQTDGVTRISITANGANCDIGSVLRPSSGSTFDLGGNARRWNNLYVNTRIFFGDSTSAADPSLKKSSTALQVRLADDSAFAPLEALSFTTANSRIVCDDTNVVLHVGNTPRFSAYGGNNQYVAIGGGTGLRFATGRSDQASIANLELIRDADAVLAQRAGTNAQTFRIYNTVSGTGNVNFDRVNFRWASNEFIIDAEAGGTGTLRGIKIGSATSSLLGFYGATPVDRPATVADPTGGGTIDTEARTAINDIIDRLQELGLIA